MKKILSVESGTVSFDAEDGSPVQVFDLSQAEKSARWLALHGASQKIGDTYAGAGAEANPVEFAKAMVAEMIGRLYAGDTGRVAGAGAKRFGLLTLAYARATGCTEDEAHELIGGLEDDERKAVQKKPKIAAALAAIKAERAIAAAKKAADLAEAATD
jgi:hypothetical protein